MGMPITLDIPGATPAALSCIFDYFAAIDERFSTYKPHSEISKINRGEITAAEYSAAMREVFALAAKTNAQTRGYFSIERPDGALDPSGIVKGWAIRNAAQLAELIGYTNYFINAGGDIASRGCDEQGLKWTVGIRSPFRHDEILKVLRPDGRGVATSGSYLRGDHIYNPHDPREALRDVVSITVVGPDVYEADRFATAAFAMGVEGIAFIDALRDCEGYSIDAHGIATMTRGFEQFVC